MNHCPAIPDRLHESAALLVLNKPCGVLTQAPPGIDSIESRLRRGLPGRPADAYLGCLHRLDRPVSGCLAFGLSRSATRRIAAQFEQREVKKTYWALVAGQPPAESGKWVDFMRKVPDEPRSELVPPQHPDAREAILGFRVLQRGAGCCWLELQLETGRTHQIRLQCAANVGPVLGDALYGSDRSFGSAVADERERSIALHARFLELEDPSLRKRIRCVAPLPAAWLDLAGVFPGLAPSPPTDP